MPGRTGGENAAQPPRDRVLDAIRVGALGVVILGHAMAWDATSGVPGSVLDGRPGLVWVTWLVQVLPLFFIVGGTANLGSWERRAGRDDFLRRRVLRLGVPSLFFAAFWTAVLLPASVAVPQARLAGDFLAQLTWFMGIYAAVIVAVPLTSRWVRQPARTHILWLTAIALVDAVRFTVTPHAGWLNLLLVWGWLHQLGYHLPVLRRWTTGRLLSWAAVTFTLTLGLAGPGPYDSALLTYAADVERSNFTPPTLVLALAGLTQVLVLAAAYPALGRLLERERLWRAVREASSRAVGLYLWHIPWVALVAVTVWATAFRPVTFGALWWVAHLLGAVVVAVGTWVTAGLARRADVVVAAGALSGRRRDWPALPFAISTTVALLLVTVTGYATWWGPVFLGIPASSVLALPLLAVSLWALARGGESGLARPKAVISPGGPDHGPEGEEKTFHRTVVEGDHPRAASPTIAPEPGIHRPEAAAASWGSPVLGAPEMLGSPVDQDSVAQADRPDVDDVAAHG